MVTETNLRKICVSPFCVEGEIYFSLFEILRLRRTSLSNNVPDLIIIHIEILRLRCTSLRMTRNGLLVLPAVTEY